MRHFIDLKIIPPVIAHRGAKAFAPENTLAAFLTAKTKGFSWVEFDVMLSADHELVVIHDEDLNRTTNGSGAVIDYPYAYLQTLDAGMWFNSQFMGEKIPTLRSVLAFLYEHQLSANIELKALPGYEELLVNKVVQLLNEPDMKFTLPPLLSSFSESILRLIRRHSADYLLGFLMDEWITDWQARCDQLQCVSVNVNHEILTESSVAAIKETHRYLLAYTVNNVERAKELYAWGVDAIFSDCPQEIIAMIK